MEVRKQLEELEHQRLSPKAAFSDQSKGRLRPLHEQESDVRTCYQRDTDRIVHCKAFRRLMHKTQVFLQPEGDHYRTRMTHTIEVARIARTIARALRLNEDLAEAAAMGHDLGHTPFGHAGEIALSECLGKPFRHNEQSLRVVDVLENDGNGLNLSYEVRMAIRDHTGGNVAQTLEGQLIRFSDQIAYVNHDIDDAMRAGILTEGDVPRSITRVLGENHSQRINTLVCDVVTASQDSDRIAMSPEVEQAHKDLRAFMFERVYQNPEAKSEEGKAEVLMETLYLYYMKHVDDLPEEFLNLLSEGEPREKVVCDYVGAMSDRFAIAKYEEIYIPKSWHV
mgnify:CR=1 FL=1